MLEYEDKMFKLNTMADHRSCVNFFTVSCGDENFHDKNNKPCKEALWYAGFEAWVVLFKDMDEFHSFRMKHGDIKMLWSDSPEYLNHIQVLSGIRK
jgi:hypothetical protein